MLKKWIVIGVVPGLVILPNNESVDLSKINDEKANEIMTDFPDFPYLKAVDEKPSKNNTEAKS